MRAMKRVVVHLKRGRGKRGARPHTLPDHAWSTENSQSLFDLSTANLLLLTPGGKQNCAKRLIYPYKSSRPAGKYGLSILIKRITSFLGNQQPNVLFSNVVGYHALNSTRTDITYWRILLSMMEGQKIIYSFHHPWGRSKSWNWYRSQRKYKDRIRIKIPRMLQSKVPRSCRSRQREWASHPTDDQQGEEEAA